jgi:uncharacterized protein (TIGR02145 family)
MKSKIQVIANQVIVLSLLMLLFSCGEKVKDVDGNVYDVVKIGDQYWMQQNLRTAHYNDKSEIPTNLSDNAWGNDKDGACTIYKDSSNTDTVKNNKKYGKLYNWYAITNKKGIAPKGWHVATKADWDQLRDYLGGQLAGNKLKTKKGWDYDPRGIGNNSSRFSAKAAGLKNNDFGFSNDIGKSACFWTSSIDNTHTSNGIIYPYSCLLGYNYPNISYDGFWAKNYGMSVRCVKD